MLVTQLFSFNSLECTKHWISVLPTHTHKNTSFWNLLQTKHGTLSRLGAHNPITSDPSLIPLAYIYRIDEVIIGQ